MMHSPLNVKYSLSSTNWKFIIYTDIILIWKVLNNWSSWCPGMWHWKMSKEIWICEPTGSAKTLTPNYWTTLCQISESHDINTHHQKNLKLYIKQLALYCNVPYMLEISKLRNKMSQLSVSLYYFIISQAKTGSWVKITADSLKTLSSCKIPHQ